MQMKKPLLFSLSFFLISCYTPNTTIVPQKGADFDRVVNAADLSFFGGFKYDSMIDSKVQHNYTLLFKNDVLTGFYVGRKTAGRYFKVLQLGDSLTMLSSSYIAPRYLVVDTLVFYKDECFYKNELNESTAQQTIDRWAGMTYFKYYDLRGAQCNVFEKSCSDTVAAFRPILTYARTKSAAPVVALELNEQFRDIVYSDKENLKSTFFRNYIR
jgi:hypothetical protein